MRKLRERPLQVYLRPDQDSALRHLAKTQNVAIAELVRRSVDQMIAALPVEQDPLWGIVGLGDGGPPDIAENHDKYLYEIYSAESERWRKNSLSTRRRGSRSRTRKTTTTKQQKKPTRARSKTIKSS